MIKIDVKSPKKYLFPINILIFNLVRLFSVRDKKLWVFGAREGHQYDDNSRYLFEYINNHKEGIRAVWLTRERKIAEIVREKGFEAYTVYSFRGILAALRAGGACYTNGLIDFCVLPLIGGSKIVALWHGMGFKKIYNGKYHGKTLKCKKIIDRFFSWTYRDITLSTSNYANLWLEEMFTLNKEKIFITGQPRNDAFRYVSKNDVLSKVNIDGTKRIVLYMPTYRQTSLGEDAMEEIVKNLYDNNQLCNVLDKTNSVFVVKLHPLTPHIDIKNRENFIILDYGAVENNQKLLGCADILVTDYSSCFIDYALLKRPIVFYVPDEDRFVEESEKLDDMYFEIEKLCRTENPVTLSNQLLSPHNKVSCMTNEIFEDESICGTCYSENVYRVICRELWGE